jgi:hypothetical protein
LGNHFANLELAGPAFGLRFLTNVSRLSFENVTAALGAFAHGFLAREVQLGDRFFRMRSGWLSRATHIVPIRNVQSIVVRQTPFDRRHKVSTLVVDSAAAGVTLLCQKCGLPTVVPNPSVENAAGNSVKISELQRHLKENESQRIEITGYINQLNIQLYSWQLRMETLKERQQKLQNELVSLCGRESVENPSASKTAKTQMG